MLNICIHMIWLKTFDGLYKKCIHTYIHENININIHIYKFDKSFNHQKLLLETGLPNNGEVYYSLCHHIRFLVLSNQTSLSVSKRSDMWPNKILIKFMIDHSYVCHKVSKLDTRSFPQPQACLLTDCTTSVVCAPIYENVYVCETKTSTSGVGKSYSLTIGFLLC